MRKPDLFPEDEWPYQVICLFPDGAYTTGFGGTGAEGCYHSAIYRSWEEIEAAYNLYAAADLLGCGGYEYDYPESTRAHFDSVDLLSKLRAQWAALAQPTPPSAPPEVPEPSPPPPRQIPVPPARSPPPSPPEPSPPPPSPPPPSPPEPSPPPPPPPPPSVSPPPAERSSAT